MSLLVNLTKSLTSSFIKNLTPTFAGNAEVAGIGTGVQHWCVRAKKNRCKDDDEKSASTKVDYIQTLRNILPGIKGRLSSDLNSVWRLSGMRSARLFSMSAREGTHGSPPVQRGHTEKQRVQCGRQNCEDPCKWPECFPGNENPKFIKYPSQRFNIYQAYWELKNDACCDDECQWASPRFDDIYLQESDKAERTYTKTWRECPELRKVPKKVCCYEQASPLEYCRRPKKERPVTACKCPPGDLGCPSGDLNCVKLVKDPCCCEARFPPKCRPWTRGLQDCKKFCTPYPSFSECNRAKKRPRAPVECRCQEPLTMCQFWDYWRTKVLTRAENFKCYTAF